jgi:tetratricopeptide (TPR) repeat protein
MRVNRAICLFLVLAVWAVFGQTLRHEFVNCDDDVNAEARNNLGIALARQGKLIEAIQQFQQALNLATARNNTAFAEAIQTRLKACQSALPRPQTP